MVSRARHPGYEPLAPPPAPTATAVPVWQDRTIASSKLRMLEYSAFMEVQRDPDNVSGNLQSCFPRSDTDGLLKGPIAGRCLSLEGSGGEDLPSQSSDVILIRVFFVWI